MRNAFLALTTTALLLASGSAGAQTVITVSAPQALVATDILDLNVEGTLYDVSFIRDSAENIYGPLPSPDFDFDTSESAGDAVVAITEALTNLSNASAVGDENNFGTIFIIGFELGGSAIPVVSARQGIA